MKLFTARYANPRIKASGLVPVRITRGHPRFVLKYELGGTVMELAPLGSMLSMTVQREFDEKYSAMLDRTGVKKIRRLLERVSEGNDGRDLVLLCFEDLRKPELFCHRRSFAKWWFEKTGELVGELPEEVPAPQGDLFRERGG